MSKDDGESNPWPSDPKCPFSNQAGESGVQLLQLKNQIKGLKERIKTLEREIKDIISAKNDELSQMKQEYEGDIENLREELQKHSKNVISLQKRIEQLEETNEDLRAGLQESGRGYDLLYIAQAAALFERAICAHVLPAVFENDNFATIKRLLDYLNGNKAPQIEDHLLSRKKEILDEAKQKWAEVCHHLHLPDEWKTGKLGKDIDWSDCDVPKIIRAIYFLKESRLPVAHPNKISLEEAKLKLKSIAKVLTPPQHRMVTTLIDQLKENVEKIGLQISDEELTA